MPLVIGLLVLVEIGLAIRYSHIRAQIEVRVRSIVHGAQVDRRLTPVPPMGFNDWNAFHCTVTEADIEGAAVAMVARGLRAAGYRYVNLDDCWSAPARDARGTLQANPQRFPSGIPALARYVHSLGLKFGIYADLGTKTCAGYPGSYGYEARDAATFARWGIDYVKLDWCYVPYNNFPDYTDDDVAQVLYTRMLQALNATHRPMIVSVSNASDPTIHPWLWGPSVSNLWRTTADIADTWTSILHILDENVQYAARGGPGHWNDPDMLEVGNGGMTEAEDRAHFSLWSMMAAPLLLGTDLRTMSAASQQIVTNRAVIAVDQDPRGIGATVVSRAGNGEILVRPLANGDRAVLFLDRGAPSVTLTAHLSNLGLTPQRRYIVRDLWQGTTYTVSERLTVTVPPNSAVMVRIHGE